ncbi:isopeptide-forming domain-containing fimbrial protein [Companilactobacillus muriivasis]|uniref:isopeptide-forming domain-containing fimbrial protein n=1 Tax=Companilactobacillus muriivasis TaxID=3081444 RepID=UPI0030C6D62F
MKRNKLVTRLLFVLFTTLMMVLTLNKMTLTVDAISAAEYTAAEKIFEKHDGITNWKLQNNSPSNEIGKIPIGGNISLGYTFGAARNSSGKVISGDNTITKKSSTPTVNGAPTITNGKINIFLDYGGQYYGIIHQGANSYIGSGGTPETASDTSIDYALLTGSAVSNYYSAMNLYANLNVIDSGANTTKQFYIGSDPKGRPVYKLLGYYTKTNVFFEIVLRPALNGAPIVQRELYVYNADSNTKQFQTFYGEDTGLSPKNGDTAVDNVPMFAIGGGEGLYLMSGTDSDGNNYDPASKLFVTNVVPGGFKDFMGRILTNPSDWGIKGKEKYGSTSDITNPKLPWSTQPNDTQNGDTADKADTNLLISNGNKVVNSSNMQDSAYTLRWPATNLASGQVQEYSSTIGATVAGYAAINVSKTYTNQSSSSGNHVGDTLKFTLKVKNEGYKSTWLLSHVVDNMPTGLTIDPNSVMVGSKSMPSTWVNNNSLDCNPSGTIPDSGSNSTYTITFNATINNQAPYNNGGNLTNTATFTGQSANVVDTPADYSDSVKIPVITPTFKYRFTNQVRNDTTDPNGAFSSKTTGKKDDIVEYKVNFNSTGNSSLSSANFANNLPDGLELVPGSVTLNGASKDSLNFSTGSLSNNVNNIISFKAKITGIAESTASDNAYLNNVSTNTGQQYSSIENEAPADVDIEAAPLTTSFVEVPTTIDFGSVNSAGLERTLPNVSTTGKLVITHSADTPFQVSVSYDNNGDQPIASNGTKLIQDGGESLLFNQAKSDSDENWHPLTTDPVPINSDGFSGSHTNYDLTDYIGANKWKLRVPADSKAGAYSGQVTWSINDSI